MTTHEFNEKKTAVDSIIAKLNNVKPAEFCSIETIKEWCQQAKELEKQQIINAHLRGLIHPLEMEGTKQAEQYYNETFNTKEK